MALGNGRHDGSDGSFQPRLSLADIAARLKGKISIDDKGQQVVRCPGPDHSAGDASLTIGLDDDASGGFWVLSFSPKDDDPLRLKDWARTQLGLPAFKPNGKGHAPRDEVIAKYEYRDADGGPVLLVNRTKAKKFLQQRPDGLGGWDWGGIADAAKVPFRLADLIEAIALGKTVFITEGEKGALSLIERGYPATCSPGGAGKWPDHFATWFEGAKVVILPDHDDPGRKHAAKVRSNLEGVAASVRVIHLPGLASGGDIHDFLSAGGDPATIETMHEGPPPRGYRATDLWGMTFPPINFAVPGYIAEGLTLLAGAPKRGKSWLALDLCCAVATGGFTLGDQKCTEGDVLYCALEDSPRRMKSRLQIVCQLAKRAPERLTIWFGDDLPRLGDGCEDRLRDWLKSKAKPRMVIIDTLNYIRPDRNRDEDPYSYDYRSATTLQRLAGEFGIAIILIHHTRKSAADDYLESISGTNGLTGGCDAVMVLDRQAEGATVFKGRGRDIEEFEVAMKFEKESCRWSLLGDAGENKLSETRRKILNVLRDEGEFMSVSEIASKTGLRRNAVDQRLGQMRKAGEVIKLARGKYGLPEFRGGDGVVVQFRPKGGDDDEV